MISILSDSLSLSLSLTSCLTTFSLCPGSNLLKTASPTAPLSRNRSKVSGTAVIRKRAAAGTWHTRETYVSRTARAIPAAKYGSKVSDERGVSEDMDRQRRASMSSTVKKAEPLEAGTAAEATAPYFRTTPRERRAA